MSGNVFSLSTSEDAALYAMFEKAEKEIVSGGLNEKNLIRT